jgi:HTH-type transcriptional regulator/antitoxin MqsA
LIRTALIHGTRDVSGEVDGEPYFVAQVSGWHCPVCGEIEFDSGSGEGKRFSDALQAASAKARECRARAHAPPVKN